MPNLSTPPADRRAIADAYKEKRAPGRGHHPALCGAAHPSSRRPARLPPTLFPHPLPDRRFLSPAAVKRYRIFGAVPKPAGRGQFVNTRRS